MPDHDPHHDKRLTRIERKINVVLVLVVVQSVMIVANLVIELIVELWPSFTTIFLFLLTLTVVIYFFREQLPGWSRRLGAMIINGIVPKKQYPDAPNPQSTEPSPRGGGQVQDPEIK